MSFPTFQHNVNYVSYIGPGRKKNKAKKAKKDKRERKKRGKPQVAFLKTKGENKRTSPSSALENFSLNPSEVTVGV